MNTKEELHIGIGSDEKATVELSNQIKKLAEEKGIKSNEARLDPSGKGTLEFIIRGEKGNLESLKKILVDQILGQGVIRTCTIWFTHNFQEA